MHPNGNIGKSKSPAKVCPEFANRVPLNTEIERKSLDDALETFIT